MAQDKYGISYRELEEMLEERGVELDHTTLYRWVQHYAPELQKRLKWFTKSAFHLSWRVDETYIKVKGKWAYLYRAVDKAGDTINFYLSPTRNAKAAKRLLGKTLAQRRKREKPRVINTDKAAAYSVAIQELKTAGKPKDTEHRQVKYLNNAVEADHGKLKRLIKPTLGFKSMKTAYATLKGFEVMRSLKTRQARAFQYQVGVQGEVRLVERCFNLGDCAIAEVMKTNERLFSKRCQLIHIPYIGNPCPYSKFATGPRTSRKTKRQNNIQILRNSFLGQFDYALERWTRRKYKRLKCSQAQARAWIKRVASQNPGLFIHWSITFARMTER